MAQVAFDPQGNALAIWERSDGAKPRIEAAGYDAAGPLLANLAAPATVVAGRPVAFSVTPIDSFFAVAATSWSFGDGSTASGAGVTHAYAAAGTYEVRVTASDAVGNSTSAARTIRVEPAPNVETALRIEGLSITPRRFAPVGGAVASRARKGGGTTIHYRLSEAARVSFAVERAAAGRRVGRNCVRPALHPLRAPAGRLRPGASRAPTACASTVACGGVRSPPAATGSSPSPPPATAGRRWCAPALGSWAPLSVVVDLARWRRTRWLIPN